MRARAHEGSEERRDDELHWERRPFRALLSLAWPIAVSMLSFAVMTLVDTLFVGRIGADALAGVGVGGMAWFVLVCFVMGALRGVKVAVAQAVGAGRRAEAQSYLAAGLALALSCGLLLVGAGQGLAALLPHVTASAAAGEHARTYLAIRALAVPAMLSYVALREHRYGLGDSRSPMVAAVVGNLTNVAFDTWLIFGLGWGVAGAAIATVIGQSVQLVALLLPHARSVRMRGLALAHVRRLLRLGAPMGLQFLLEVGAFAALAAMLAAMSAVDMAAHQIALQVIHFTFLPVLAVAEAGAVLTGQAVGARRDHLVPGVAHRGLAVTVGYALAWTIVLALLAEPIAAAFTEDPVLRSAAVSLLHVAAVFQLFDAAHAVARGALQGTGDVRFPALVGIVLAWVLTPPATWLLGWQLGLGALGGWLGLCAELVLGAGVLWHRLLRGGWRPAAERARRAPEAADRELVPATA